MSPSVIVPVNDQIVLSGNGRRHDNTWSYFVVQYRPPDETSPREVGRVYLEDGADRQIQIGLEMTDDWPKSLTDQIIRQICAYLRESPRSCRGISSPGVMVHNPKYPRTSQDRHLIRAFKNAGFRFKRERTDRGITYWYGSLRMRRHRPELRRNLQFDQESVPAPA